MHIQYLGEGLLVVDGGDVDADRMDVLSQLVENYPFRR